MMTEVTQPMNEEVNNHQETVNLKHIKIETVRLRFQIFHSIISINNKNKSKMVKTESVLITM